VDLIHRPAFALQLFDCGVRGGAPAEDEVAALGVAGNNGVGNGAAGLFSDGLAVGERGGEGGHVWNGGGTPRLRCLYCTPPVTA
jgi:hypothetical protein